MSTLRPKLKNKNNSNLLNIFETIGIVIFLVFINRIKNRAKSKVGIDLSFYA